MLPMGNKVPRFDSPNARNEMRWLPTFRYYTGFLDRQDEGYELCGQTVPQVWLQK